MPHLERDHFSTPEFTARRAEISKHQVAEPVPLVLSPALCDPDLLASIGPEFALRQCVAPIRKSGSVTVVARSDVELSAHCRSKLEAVFGAVAFVTASTIAIRNMIETTAAPALAAAAATRTCEKESCRGWSKSMTGTLAAAVAFLLFGFAWFAPKFLMGLLVGWATATLLAVTGLRTVGALVQLRFARTQSIQWRTTRNYNVPPDGWPKISVIVPLFHENAIAERLVRRLEALHYPREKLEINLVLEADDYTTRRALGATSLPTHIQTLIVPSGEPRTKPRALNYALDYCRGTIIGVYDAEDAPAPDQLCRVAQAFAKASPDVGCLQGVLDFYNSDSTWLTRCFTIDYATWFRLVLPGLVRLGLAIPLGGTTVFFKRDVLEKVGRWDAHNVTEDADLGIRLARRGFRTEFIASVTHEEATATVRAWIRQRSRWIKGYAMTWAVHMRSPFRTLRELGTWRFLGFQIVFLGSLSQFVLAPLLWSFWLVLFGLPHPALQLAPWAIVVSLGILFLLAEVATLTVSALSVATPRHRHLIWWVPFLHLYFPLAAFACWKGLFELVTRPFFWDKTAHGGAFSRQPRGWSRRPLQRPA